MRAAAAPRRAGNIGGEAAKGDLGVIGHGGSLSPLLLLSYRCSHAAPLEAAARAMLATTVGSSARARMERGVP